MAEGEDSGADPTDGSPERTPPAIAGNDPPGAERAAGRGSVPVERVRMADGGGGSGAAGGHAAGRRPTPYLVCFGSAFQILKRSEPDLTEEAAVCMLLDAISNGLLRAKMPDNSTGPFGFRYRHPTKKSDGGLDMLVYSREATIRAMSFDKDELQRLFPSQAQASPAPREGGAGGAPPKYPWNALACAFGAWLHQELGRAELKNKDLMNGLAEVCATLGCEVPPRETARAYLKDWARTYRTYSATLDGGN